jgi:hypothetical protein
VRAEALDPALATTAFINADGDGKVFLDSTRAGGGSVAAAYSPRLRPGAPVSFPVAWSDLADVTPADFTLRTVPARLGDTDPWTALMPPPQAVPAELVEQGRTIPAARAQALHEEPRRHHRGASRWSAEYFAHRRFRRLERGARLGRGVVVAGRTAGPQGKRGEDETCQSGEASAHRCSPELVPSGT